MARRRLRNPRAMTVASARRQFARKKTDWLNVFSTTCDEIEFLPPNADECPSAFQLPLIDSTYIETAKEDNLTVKRILGDLWIQINDPYQNADPVDHIFGLAQMAVLMRISLKRFEIAAGAPQELIFNPMLGEDIQIDPVGEDQGDFSEMRAIKQWQHLFHHSVGISGSTVAPQIVSRTFFEGIISGTETAVVGTGSSPGTSVWGGTIGGEPVKLQTEYDCSTLCGEQFGSATTAVTLRDTWHIPFNLKFRKGISLRENQGLALFGGWEDLHVNGRPEQPGIVIMGGLRMLVET